MDPEIDDIMKEQVGEDRTDARPLRRSCLSRSTARPRGRQRRATALWGTRRSAILVCTGKFKPSHSFAAEANDTTTLQPLTLIQREFLAEPMGRLHDGTEPPQL